MQVSLKDVSTCLKKGESTNLQESKFRVSVLIVLQSHHLLLDVVIKNCTTRLEKVA